MVTVVVTFLWRDIWALIDVYLIPDKPIISAYASIVSEIMLLLRANEAFFKHHLQVIGYTLSLICFAAETTVGNLCQKYDKHRVYIHNAFVILCLLATVTVWRGLWNTLELKLGKSFQQLSSIEFKHFRTFLKVKAKKLCSCLMESRGSC